MKKSTRVVLVFSAATFLQLCCVHGAGALDQLQSISNLPAIDLHRLEQGDIVGARGELGSFSRGVYAESCYFIHAPVPVVGKKLLHWNAAAHPELEIRTLHEYRWPATPNAWDSLTLSSKRREDRWLTERTSQLSVTSGAPTELHVTRDDIAAFRNMTPKNGGRMRDVRDTTISQFWRKILRDRNDALANNGLGGLPSYAANGVHIETRSEFENLLKLTPGIAAHFHALVSAPPFVAGAILAASEAVPYWEAALVRGHTNVQEGFLVARRGATTWQIADCTYYTSDTFFMSVTLYELFPQDNGTLVWQTDFASAPFRSFAAGLDRVFAGNEMVKEAAATAKLFRADVESNR